MIVFPDITSPKIAEMLNSGAIGVLLTDTLYGVVARADNEAAVERVFAGTAAGLLFYVPCSRAAGG